MSAPSMPSVSESLYIRSVHPTLGRAQGGTQLTIRAGGSTFERGATVTVGDVPCDNVIYVSPEELRCTTGPYPDHESNHLVHVSVYNPSGRSAASLGYLYVSDADQQSLLGDDDLDLYDEHDDDDKR